MTNTTPNLGDSCRNSSFPSPPRTTTISAISAWASPSAEGIDRTWLNLGHHECFARFTANREFDLSELSFAKFSTAGDARRTADIIGLPVICSRLFRFSSFYVNRKSRHQNREGSEGEEDRLAGMGAFGGGLHARLDAQRDGREADRTCTGTRRAPTRRAARRRSSSICPRAEAHARRRQVA